MAGLAKPGPTTQGPTIWWPARPGPTQRRTRRPGWRQAGCCSPGTASSSIAAQRLDQLPEPGLPEVAFAGRSNVGKSSLVNALTGRKALARASNTPGRTRQLNFFDLARRLTLVDMPGYGYAQAAKEVKADWQGLMFEYLRGRPTLQRVVLLLDSRIELKASDLAVMELLDRAAVTYQIVLTKADGIRPGALAPQAGRGPGPGAQASRRLPGRAGHQQRDRGGHGGAAGGPGGAGAAGGVAAAQS